MDRFSTPSIIRVSKGRLQTFLSDLLILKNDKKELENLVVCVQESIQKSMVEAADVIARLSRRLVDTKG